MGLERLDNLAKYLFGDVKKESNLLINQKYVITRKYDSPDKKPPFENEWLIQVISLYPDEPGIVQIKFLSSKIKNRIKNIRIDDYEFQEQF